MRYVVTGASGFAGRHLVRLLALQGRKVVGLVRAKGDLSHEPATEVTCDVLNAPAVRSAVHRIKPVGIFHLAAPQTSVGRSWQEPAQTIWANLAATLTVLEAARTLSSPAKVLFVSSAEVLGSVPASKQPLTETMPLHPESPYALSKMNGEQAARFYNDRLGLSTIIVRAFTHIGPGQQPAFVLPSFARQIAAAESTGRGRLRVGNLDTKRDFTDVRDMVRAYAILMEKGKPGEVYHAGSGNVYAIKELLELLIKRSTAKIEIVRDSARVRPTDIPLMRSSARKLKKLGWRPEIPIEQTLDDILTEARKEAKQ